MGQKQRKARSRRNKKLKRHETIGTSIADPAMAKVMEKKIEMQKFKKNVKKEKANLSSNQERTNNKYEWTLATWNIRGLRGKENELVQEFEEANLTILAITETKKKECGTEELKNGHMMIYSGVKKEERAQAGVGCIIHNKAIKYVKNWEHISERALRINWEIEKGEKLELLVLYGPNDDDKAAIKDKFWNEISDIIEDMKGRIIVIGDLNGRVGSKDDETGEVLGTYGENFRNSNGERIINLCMQNDMLVMNTFFEHRDIHKYTRVVKTRNEKSIIDYVLINRMHRKEIQDVKVRRGSEINSDHFLVVSKIVYSNQNTTTKENKQSEEAIHLPTREAIRSYRLSEQKVAKEFRKKLEAKIEKIDTRNLNLEQAWGIFRNAVIKSAREVCGIIKINRNRKQTNWWNDEIKNEVKLKKKKWKQYLQTGTEKSHNEYREQRNRIKIRIKEAKKRSWEEFGNKLENDYHSNQKLFYKVLKNLRTGDKQQNTKRIKDKTGKIITNKRDIMECWKDYFQDLFNADEESKDIEMRQEVEQERLAEDPGMIAATEIKEAIKKLKKGKAAGHDQITGEMLKWLGEASRALLTEIINKAWREGRVPRDWQVGIIVPIFKKGNRSECANYRGITLLSVVSKVYERILEQRLRREIEPNLEESQSGFMKGRSAQDHVFTIKQMSEKAEETGKSIYIAYIDIEKAFDKVPRKLVEKSLIQRNVNISLKHAIMSLYSMNKNYVRTDNMESEEFRIKEGLRQGAVLSPVLFNIIMDDIIKEINNRVSQITIGHRNLQPVQIKECAFADDVAIFARSENELQKNLEIWIEALSVRRLKINMDKTKVMVIGKTNTAINIEISGKRLEQVHTFKYLGIQINSKGKQETEITARIESASRVYHSIRNSFVGKAEVSRKTKISVYNAVFIPTLIYGSESWVLTKKLKSKIQTLEMKYLRKVLGVTRKDKIRNTIIRDELKVEPVVEKIERNNLRWFGHLTRMKNQRPVKRVWEAQILRKRGKGRPKITWNENIKKILEQRGITLTAAKILARDKKKWKKFIYKEDTS